jgi:hypothetical protein
MTMSRASMGIRISRSGKMTVKTKKPVSKVKSTKIDGGFEARPRRTRRPKRILK